MRNRPLKCHHWRQMVHMHRKTRGSCLSLKAKVIIPMRVLRRTTRTDNIDLRRHLIPGPQPSFADGIQGGRPEIKRESLRICQA